MHADITMNESRLLLPQKGVHMPKSFNTTGICIPEKHYMVNEYSCAVTPQVRQTGNRLSGLAGTAYASLLA